MRLFAILVLAVLSACVQADTVFNYDGFYARMKKSEQPQYSEVTLTFVLQKQATIEPCQIENAKLTTDISEEKLTIASNGELILPFEKLFNDRKALIRLKQPAGAVSCDLNFRLRNKMPLSNVIRLKQLRATHQQFDLLLKDLAGMGKYFLPAMTGVTVQFPKANPVLTSSARVEQAWRCEAKHCHLDLSQLVDEPDDVELQFSETPEYLFPYIPR
jgi:hypothetical protein